MAKIGKLPGLRIISGFRHVIDFYIYHPSCDPEARGPGTACARSWPRSPGRKRSPAVEEQWPVFRTAAELWRQLSPEVRQAYEAMAVPTNLTAKDMFFRGYISGILRYYVPVDELEGS